MDIKSSTPPQAICQQLQQQKEKIWRLLHMIAKMAKTGGHNDHAENIAAVLFCNQ